MSGGAELLAAGVNVAFGHDCVMDPWYLLGSGDMLEVSCDASFVMLQARDPIEAIRLRANRLKVWRKGKLLAETAEVVARLRVARRPDKIGFSQA